MFRRKANIMFYVENCVLLRSLWFRFLVHSLLPFSMSSFLSFRSFSIFVLLIKTYIIQHILIDTISLHVSFFICIFCSLKEFCFCLFVVYFYVKSKYMFLFPCLSLCFLFLCVSHNSKNVFFFISSGRS